MHCTLGNMEEAGNRKSAKIIKAPPLLPSARIMKTLNHNEVTEGNDSKWLERSPDRGIN